MSYQIIIDSGAGRELDKLPKDVQRRLRRAIDNLATEPRPPGAERMTGADAYRIRVGVYRIVYAVKDEVLVVLVVKAGHRTHVYTDLDTIRRRLR